MADVLPTSTQFPLPMPRDRKLYLSAQVTQESMNAIAKEIIEINESDKLLVNVYSLFGLSYIPHPIKLFIDSYGGYVYQCFGLLSIMDASETPIQTIVTGCAMSCGFMISIHGHERFCYPNSTLLYHQVSSGTGGKLKEMEEDVFETKRLQKMIEKMVLSKTKISKERLEKSFKLKEDWFMSAEEALKLKCVDEIL